MFPRKYVLADVQLLQYRPVCRVYKIAAQLVSGKYGAVDQQNAITEFRECNRCRRARGPATDNGDIENLHQCPSRLTQAAMRNGKTENISIGPIAARVKRFRHSLNVNARWTDSGASVSVMVLRVVREVSRQMP